MPQYFIRFPSETMRPMAMSMLAADPERFRAFESTSEDQILIADLSDDQRYAAESNGAKVYLDIRYKVDASVEEARTCQAGTCEGVQKHRRVAGGIDDRACCQ